MASIKTTKFYNTDKSLNELRLIEKRLENMVRKSQEAIEKASEKDWRYGKTEQHQLYQELLKDRNRLPIANKQQTIQSINKLQQMLKGKGGTLKGTKEIIKNREEAFVKKAVAGGLSERKARQRAKSKDFYNFLHSDTYKKLTASTGKAGSGVIVQNYLKHEENANDYYDKLLAKKEDNFEEVTYKEVADIPKEFLK